MGRGSTHIQLEYCDRNGRGRDWLPCAGPVYETAKTMAEGRALAKRLNKGMPAYRFRVRPIQPAGFCPTAVVQLEPEDIRVIRLALVSFTSNFTGPSTVELRKHAGLLIERSESW